MLCFEIKQREGDFYSEHTDRRTEPPSIVLVYRYDRTDDSIDESYLILDNLNPYLCSLLNT